SSNRMATEPAGTFVEDQGRLPPLERYFRILEALAAIPSGLTLMELATLLMLPKGTIHRLLVAMQKSDLVASVNEGRSRYVLAPRARRLAYLSADSTMLASFIEPLLSNFSAEIGETCYLARLEN